MPRTVDSAFASFDSNLNLDPDERAKAEKRHNDIREELSAAGLIVGSFLQGSFARKTMLKPLKDVDIVCLLYPDLWAVLSSPEGPDKAMESFKAPIKRRWSSVQFDVGEEPSGKALRLTFPDCDFTVDLVPAFEQERDYVLIGDRHEGTWTPSNTRIQLMRVADRNQQTEGRFVHQVREFKSLTMNEPDLDFVKGIVAESLAHAAIVSKVLDKEASVAVLRHAAAAVLGPVIEPAGEDDVTVKWSHAEHRKAAELYGKAARRAQEALDLERALDITGAIDIWHSLFGDEFPAAPDRSPHGTMTAWASGSVSVTGRPSSTRAATQQSAPGRAWRSR